MLKSPYPYFGGKSKVAPLIWQYLGDVDNYAEPFFGSGAALLGRPDEHRRLLETVNDIDHYIVNFWRAVSAAPDEVARWADWPTTEADLTARHIWLVNEGRERIANVEADPDAYDAKVAGWWVWGICNWIGAEWCSGTGPWRAEDGQLVKGGNLGLGVNRKLPHMGGGKGVNRKRPHLGNAGRGVKRQLPHLGDAGRGVNRTNNGSLSAYMAALAERLRQVLVCCGDWSRIVTPGALAYGDTVGILLDPPYNLDMRNAELYNHETRGLSDEVRAWALANGDNPRYRIILCGYDGEHAMPGWRVVEWKAGASYQTANSAGQNGNRHKERLWISPHCLRLGLFE